MELAPFAEFLHHKPVLVKLLVLSAVVIQFMAFGAFHDDQIVLRHTLSSFPIPYFNDIFWSRCPESNRRPTPYHGVALPAELQRRVSTYII
jgi:hypothetical protein